MRAAVTARNALLSVGLGLIVAATACDGAGSGGGAKQTTLKLAHGLDTNHPVHQALVFMRDKLAEDSGGSLTIDIYPGEQLGNEKECLEQLQAGAIDLAKVSSGHIENFVPEFKVFAMPYLFRDSAHMWTVLRGEIGQELLEAGRSKRLLGLCYLDAGARSFYAKTPIRTPEDLNGLKVRVMQTPMSIELIQAMGGSPTPISWGELYTSLDTGVVDAAENNPPSYHTSRHFEICKYYTLDEHTRVPDVLLISTRTWDKLSDEQRALINAAADAASIEHRRLWSEAEAEALAAVQAAGAEVLEVDQAPFVAAAEAVWEAYADEPIGKLAKRMRAVE